MSVLLFPVPAGWLNLRAMSIEQRSFHTLFFYLINEVVEFL